MHMPLNSLERHTASTANVVQHERIDYWRDAIRSDLLDLNFHVPDDAEFDASLVATRLTPLRVLSIRSSASTVERRCARSTFALDDAVMFNFVFSGRMVAHQDGRTCVIGAGDGVMCTGGRPYTLQLLEDTHLACISLAPAMLGRSVAAADRATATNFSAGSELTPIVSSYAFHLLDAVTRLSDDGANIVAQNFAGLLTAMMGQVAAGVGPTLSEQRTVLLVLVKDFIERHLGDADLDAARVASAMRLSHRYINRIFEADGLSLSRYIWQRRVERAAHDLRSPALKTRGIAQIALSNGFNNMTHFSKAFRTRYDMSPRDFRRASAMPTPRA